jgi:squalene-hopene/tetraprenyl-beta-curcumene cyclase
MNAFRRLTIGAVAVGVVLAAVLGRAAEQTRASGPDPQQWERTVDRAINYLKGAQAENGSWSKDPAARGVTGVALTGMLKTGKITPQDPTAEKALKYIESLINPKAGHIAGKDPAVGLQNYVTSINVMALCAADRDSYKLVIADAVKFLKKLQWDEEEGKKPSDDFYGGAGYDSKSRPDLSNTQLFLDALREAGVPPDDPALKKAMRFVSRCQNLKSEHNDRPWAGKINDGSFIYTAAGGGETKVDVTDGSLPGYGSMTYAGIKSLIYCGVSKDDPRIQKAYEWIQKHYTVDANPGMTPQAAHRGLYYYYHTMAKCLDTLGIDQVEVIHPDGKKELRDWRADLTAALAKRQRADGSWVNDLDRWMEGDPNLVTGYALMALSYCKPRR